MSDVRTEKHQELTETNLVGKVLSLPGVDHALGLEVVEVVKVEVLVLGRELGRSRLSAVDDLVDVAVNHQTARARRGQDASAERSVSETGKARLTCLALS